MATTPPDDELLADEQPDEQLADEQADDEQPSRAERVALNRAQQRLLREFMTGQKEERQDVAKNRAKIRRVMIDYIKNELRSPTVQEICEATGLSDKTVKQHKKHIKLGDGKANMYQDLTPDIMMSLHKKAKGYTITEEKLLVVSGGQGMGSEVERHEVDKYVHPETAAIKLWLQVVEGHSDTTKTEHSGEVKTGGGVGFYFEYIVPEAPKNE